MVRGGFWDPDLETSDGTVGPFGGWLSNNEDISDQKFLTTATKKITSDTTPPPPPWLAGSLLCTGF